MRRYRIMACVVLLAMMMFTLTWASPASAKQYTVGLIVKNLVNPFWNYMKQGAEDVGRELGVNVITLAPIKADNVEEQIRAMEDLIKRKVDGIVLVPADSNGIVPGILKANAAGIPVITSNTRAFGGNVISFVGVENYDAAYSVATHVAEQLHGKGQVVILEGVPGAQTAIDRKKGFDDALAKYPGIKVLASQPAKFQRAEGMLVMENLIQRFPNFNAVICGNDEMALGAIEALDAAGRLKGTIVSGFDGNRDAMMSIAEGKLMVTLYQNPQAQAGDAVRALIDHIEGRPVPDRVVVKGTLVTKANVDGFLEMYGVK
ncbi:MAG: sugar ABC transporter substrate-binding protein [Bacillota bacterium]